MSAEDEYRMMLRMAENHVLEASKHREMVEEKAHKGIKEARAKVAREMGEMIEKGYGNVTFGSEGIRPGEYIERTKGELERSELERSRRRRIEFYRGIWQWRKKGRVAKLLEVWVKKLCPQVMMLLC